MDNKLAEWKTFNIEENVNFEQHARNTKGSKKYSRRFYRKQTNQLLDYRQLEIDKHDLLVMLEDEINLKTQW